MLSENAWQRPTVLRSSSFFNSNVVVALRNSSRSRIGRNLLGSFTLPQQENKCERKNSNHYRKCYLGTQFSTACLGLVVFHLNIENVGGPTSFNWWFVDAAKASKSKFATGAHRRHESAAIAVVRFLVYAEACLDRFPGGVAALTRASKHTDAQRFVAIRRGAKAVLLISTAARKMLPYALPR